MAIEVPQRTVFNTCCSCLRSSRLARRVRLSSFSPSTSASSDRSFSHSASTSSPEQDNEASLPRWQRTPPRMTMPVRGRARPQGEFKVNNDPQKLDRALASFFAVRGEIPLSEEVKWLAVTHKSFDHGRRGFNDRLAFLGKRIVDLQTSIALLDAPAPNVPRTRQDQYGRDVYQHEDLIPLDNLTPFNKASVLDKRRLANLAKEHALHEVIRWKPKQHDSLNGSGQDSVLVQTIYSIVGALALEKGGHVANTFARQRILAPLGL